MTNSPSKSNSQEAENGLAPDSRDEYSADLQRLRDIAVEQLCGLASHSHRSDGSATEVTHSSTNSNQVVVDRPRPTGHNSQQAKRHTEDVMPPIHVTKKDTRAATASSATAITARSPSRKSESGISASDGEESNSSSSQSDGDDYEDDPSGDTKMKQNKKTNTAASLRKGKWTVSYVSSFIVMWKRCIYSLLFQLGLFLH